MQLNSLLLYGTPESPHYLIDVDVTVFLNGPTSFCPQVRYLSVVEGIPCGPGDVHRHLGHEPLEGTTTQPRFQFDSTL